MRLFLNFIFCLIVFGSSIAAIGQVPQTSPTPKVKLTGDAKLARDQSLQILDEIKTVLEEHYYDPKFRGIDLKTRIEKAKERVKSLQYNWQMYRVLVQVLMEFDDSHTRMSLPPRDDYFEYGVSWQMIGSDLFVKSVEKESDAAAKGLEIGDQITKIGKFTPSRKDLWKMEYVLFRLDPEKTLDLGIRKPTGEEKSITITAKTYTEKEFRLVAKARLDKIKKEDRKPYKCVELSQQVAVCKLYSFVVEKNDIDKMMAFARKYPKLILDLRGNGGGYVTVQKYLASHFFPERTKIMDIVTKRKTETHITDVLDKDRQYAGEVTVLIDSRSASASEITAGMFQLEKRAKIMGDISAGGVMTSIYIPFYNLASMVAGVSAIRVGMSVTIADVIMRDGSRIEHVGVVPDQILQPTGLAIKLKMDAALAYAASDMGVTLSPTDAGKLDLFIRFDDDVEVEVSGDR